MKWIWRAGVAAGGVLLAAGLSAAQVPGGMPAGAPGTGAASGLPGAPAPTTAPQGGFFSKMCAGFDACRQKLCASPAGQMLNNMTKPLSFGTGGVIPPFCPVMPSAQDLAQPGVAGASDAIKKDTLEAQMRREKVRFLGTVDCRYYPDAIVALTAALRTDGSECVRYEAALALSHGCCCNQKTIDALDACVSGTDKDGNPAERSVRVRCAAAIGLERCLACYVAPPIDVEPTEVKPELKGPEIGSPSGSPSTGVKKTSSDAPPPLLRLPDDTGSKKTSKVDNQKPTRESAEAALKTLNDFNALLAASRTRAVAPAPSSDRFSIYQIIKNTAAPSTPAVTQANVSLAQAPPSASGPPPIAAAGRTSLGQPSTDSTSTSIDAPVVTQAAPPRPLATDSMAAAPLTGTAMAMAGSAPSASAELHPELTPSVQPIPPAVPPAAPQTQFVASLVPSANSTVSGQPTGPSTSPTTNPINSLITLMLHGSTPMDRHIAIRQLMRFEWQKNPIILSALLAGAKNDPSPAVRVDCMRHLAGYQMIHPQVIAELGPLTQDSDPWVRDEAVKALAQLKHTP